MPEVEPIEIRWQFCRRGFDITDQLYSHEDADIVRAWEDDFCVIELTRDPLGRWTPSGGDGKWSELDGQVFAAPAEALAEYMGDIVYAVVD